MQRIENKETKKKDRNRNRNRKTGNKQREIIKANARSASLKQKKLAGSSPRGVQGRRGCRFGQRRVQHRNQIQYNALLEFYEPIPTVRITGYAPRPAARSFAHSIESMKWNGLLGEL